MHCCFFFWLTGPLSFMLFCLHIIIIQQHAQAFCLYTYLSDRRGSKCSSELPEKERRCCICNRCDVYTDDCLRCQFHTDFTLNGEKILWHILTWLLIATPSTDELGSEWVLLPLVHTLIYYSLTRSFLFFVKGS